ncbi:hypothetical protein VTJ04DRAFT_1376 [Mycothermus thermophilus]|uniref:uncharacterized protein n=1 Tax=Humicola insolens TaxID=85995 RepID=UPI003741EF5B
MKTLFPTGNIPVLGARISFDRSGSRVFPVPDGAQSSGNEQSTKIGNEDTICLSRRQAACLVVHQFLRTLRAPEWKDEEDGFHDFGLWYSGAGQRQESAAKAYLAALMAYFDEVVCHLDNPDREWSISYTLRSVETADVTNLFSPSWWLAELDVEVVEQYDTSPYSLGLPGGAAVVAANRFIGFGQSATQEEVHVGSTPEACPAVLFTPPLSDKQVLIVRGAQGMLNITGARRNIRVEPLPTPDGGMRAWSERTMLFMDALELDMTDPAAGLPDALPENVDRELVKAYAAFSYLEPLQHVRTGLWGCGAFGGDPGIKMVVLWLAACLAGTRLVVVCDEAQREFAEHLQSFVTAYKRITGSSIHLWALIRSLPPTVSRGETLRWVCSQVEARAYNFLRT